MVILHYKKTDLNQFLFETRLDTTVDQLIKDLRAVCNMRVTLDHLCQAVEELAKLGAIKPEELRGLTTVDAVKGALDMMPAERRKKYDFFDAPRDIPANMRVVEDKNGFRWGVVHQQPVQEIMLAEVTKAREYLSKNKVAMKECLNLEGLQRLYDNLKGSMMIAHPGYHGLPDYEPVVQILEGQFIFDDRVNDNFDYFSKEEDVSIWCVGKEFQRGKMLRDHLGKNEKTKAVIRMQKSSQGPPVREPAVDAETQKKMMAFYYKKQEEQKKLEEENDDYYLNSPWANPSNLKHSLMGTGQVKWRG